MAELPVNIASTYEGSGSRLSHQQNHDTLHADYNARQHVGDAIYWGRYDTPQVIANTDITYLTAFEDDYLENYDFPGLDRTPNGGESISFNPTTGVTTFLEDGVYSVASYIQATGLTETPDVSIYFYGYIFFSHLFMEFSNKIALVGRPSQVEVQPAGSMWFPAGTTARLAVRVQGPNHPLTLSYVDIFAQRTG